MYIEPGEVYVRRLRAVSAERDALALRLRLTSALAQASLHPPGLPRSAVVCVRRLHAPRPDAFGPGRHSAHAQRAWAEACAASIARMCTSAARPARGFVPAAAESVVFADRAELLACLAGDWCAGLAQARWWWRALFKEAELGVALLAAWRAEPEYVPGALEHLARRNLARDVALALPADAARALLDGVVRRFALREMTFVLADARQELAATGDPPTGAGGTGGDNRTHDAPSAPAPWRHVVPEALGAPLSPDAACLLGVGLTLQRAPSAARASSFALGLREWLSARTRVDVAARADVTEQSRALLFEPEAGERHTTQQAGTRAAADARACADDTRRDPTVRGAGETAPQLKTLRPEAEGSSFLAAGETDAAEVSRASNAQAESSAPVVEAKGIVGLAQSDAPSAAAGAWRPPLAATAEIEDTAASEPEPTVVPEERPAFVGVADVLPLEAQIETRFGGLFFLVNLGLFLELYGDFSSPLKPGLALPVWDFCALLGERLCGRVLRDDPVWTLLAQLAGRGTRTEPGADFEPPADWRVPPEWLRPLPEAGAWRWSSAGGRLQVAHPAGFVLLDVARDGRTAASQLKAELEAYADVHAGTPLRVRRALRVRGRTPLARWLAWLSGYARVRLCYALGCSGRSLAALLIAGPARVSVTTAHVDVVMPLSELPVEVRLAGLDRDPGWVPAAGRSVAFHFD